MKTKLINMLRGKEGKKGNNGYANLNRDKWRFHKQFVMAISEIKTIPQNEKLKMNPRQTAVTKPGKWQLV